MNKEEAKRIALIEISEDIKKGYCEGITKNNFSWSFTMDDDGSYEDE